MTTKTPVTGPTDIYLAGLSEGASVLGLGSGAGHD